MSETSERFAVGDIVVSRWSHGSGAQWEVIELLEHYLSSDGRDLGPYLRVASVKTGKTKTVAPFDMVHAKEPRVTESRSSLENRAAMLELALTQERHDHENTKRQLEHVRGSNVGEHA